MQKHDSALHPQQHPCPFPYALYDSHGTLFELFQGGQAIHKQVTVTAEARDQFSVLPGGIEARSHRVLWERITPVSVREQDNS